MSETTLDQPAPFHLVQPPGGPKSPAEMELSGLDRTRQDVAGTGTRPPIHYLTGLRATAAHTGFMEFTMPVTDWLLSSRGEVSTTAATFLADAPIGGAAMTVMPPRTAIPTVELSLAYLGDAGSTHGELVGRGTLVSRDDTTAVSRVELERGDEVLATGLTRVMIEPTLVLLPEVGHEESTEPAPYQRPALGAAVPDEVWASRSGLDIVRDQIDGRLPLPPICWLFGLHPTSVSEGALMGRVLATPWAASPAGTVYGGFVAAALEWSVSGAAQTLTAPGGRERMLDLKVNYLRPLTPQGQLLNVEARLVHRGRRIVVGEAALSREDGKAIAQAVGTARLEQPMR